jgi:3-deoxy-D-manno-octulosonate 8-phosphate phosphatase (KDO 8-P phosphatase)
LKKINSNLKNKFKKVKLLILDVDGVLTDNSLYISGNGEELKRFNVSDGMGIYLAKKSGIKIALISGRKSKATQLRAEELSIEDAVLDANEKLTPYQRIKSKLKIKDEEIAFVGDDLLDVPVLKKAGVPIVVRNSNHITKKYAVYITQANGGEGAVREVIDLILESKGINMEQLI